MAQRAERSALRLLLMGWPGRAPTLRDIESGGESAPKEHVLMSRESAPSAIATIGIDIGKNTFHLVGLDQRGAIVLHSKTSREQFGRRLANLPRCLIGMEDDVGRRHVGSRSINRIRPAL
jgi:transposase